MSFVGMISAFAGSSNSVPPGWLICDGRLIEKAKYQDLYSVIGDSYGRSPEPGKYFIPDYRGLFLRGLEPKGGQRDIDGDKRFDPHDQTVVGRRVGSMQLDALQSHSHKYWLFPGVEGGIANGQNWKQTESLTHEFDKDARVSSETRPINIYVNYLICYRVS